nr:enoyl-CoA hydratase-related protein [Bradyrhizobium uaiense]
MFIRVAKAPRVHERSRKIHGRIDDVGCRIKSGRSIKAASASFLGGGGTQRLTRMVGEAKALEMILRGLTVTGRRAHEIGIVQEVVADPLTRSLEIGAELSSRGAEGLAFAKRLTRSALDRPLAEGLADERKSFSTVMRTASAREGLRAGRPPAEILEL